MNDVTGRIAYLFLDEGGNFDFSGNGTRYFCMTDGAVFRAWERGDTRSFDLVRQMLTEPVRLMHAAD